MNRETQRVVEILTRKRGERNILLCWHKKLKSAAEWSRTRAENEQQKVNNKKKRRNTPKSDGDSRDGGEILLNSIKSSSRVKLMANGNNEWSNELS